jgi:phosphomannomutase
MLAALNVLAALGEQEAPLSALMAGYTRYCASGEINSEVDDPQERIEALRAHFADRETDVDTLDGLTLTTADWWLNVRPSNTEPLLRLNVEAVDGATMAAVRDEALGVIRSRHVAPGDRAE